MTLILEELSNYWRARRWAARKPRPAYRYVSDPKRGYYYEYVKGEAAKMFWIGYWAGYRKRENEEKE